MYIIFSSYILFVLYDLENDFFVNKYTYIHTRGVTRRSRVTPTVSHTPQLPRTIYHACDWWKADNCGTNSVSLLATGMY